MSAHAYVDFLGWRRTQDETQAALTSAAHFAPITGTVPQKLMENPSLSKLTFKADVDGGGRLMILK